MPGIEFVAGIACLVLGTGGTMWAIRKGGWAVEATFWAAVVLDLAVVSSLLFDWGYLWIDRTALSIALESNIWIALPHAMALTTLMMLAVWGRSTAPWAVVISSMQTVSFIPVIILVGLDVDTSFLEVAPMFALFSSLLSAFFFIPVASTAIPSKGGRLHDVAFGPRADLIDAIINLESIGLSTWSPASVFESGSAAGTVGPSEVLLDTSPSMFPPAYALRIHWNRPGKTPIEPPEPPGFAKSENFTLVAGEPGKMKYVGLSSGGFDVSVEGLSRFLSTVSLSNEAKIHSSVEKGHGDNKKS
ncbi:MAG: hypothetical protein GXP54_10590 [Deltaproteobacteria bacterium]|nr:hypothetical protein [Deltaproteobacteria bacterium]